MVLDRQKRKDGPEADRHTLKLALVEGTGSGVMEAVNLSTLGVEKSDRGGNYSPHSASISPPPEQPSPNFGR